MKGTFITVNEDALFADKEDATNYAHEKVAEGYLVFCAYLKDEEENGCPWYVEVAEPLGKDEEIWHNED